MFGHCGEANGQTLTFKPDEGMGVLFNIFIQDHVFIEDEDEDIDDHQKIEELPKRRFVLNTIKIDLLRTSYSGISYTNQLCQDNDPVSHHKFNELQQEVAGIERGSEDFHAIKKLS